MKKTFCKLQQYIYNFSLRGKITLITSLVVIFIGITSILAISGIMHNNKTLLYQSIANSLAYSSDKITSTLESVENLSSLVIADSTIQESLAIKKLGEGSLDFNVASRNLYVTLNNYYYNYSTRYLDYMSIYSHGSPVSTNIMSYIDTESAEYADIAMAADEHPGSVKWLYSYGNEKGLILTRSIKKIKNLDLSTLGLLIMKVDIDAMIHDSTNFGDNLTNSSFILLDDKNVLYSSPSITEEAAQTLINLKSDYGIVTLDGHKFFAVKDMIPAYDLSYISLVSYDSTHQYLLKTYFLYLIIIIVSILACIFFSSYLVQNITKHFDSLILKMNVFKNNNMEILSNQFDYASRRDELGMIHVHFDDMTKRIKSLVEKNYVNEILRKDAQIKALEAQIDPHFLYNTLESINWRARAISANEISLMVESLGSLLRSTLSSTEQDFSLKQELELVRYYMTIQQIRYEDRLNYTLDVEDNLLDAQIPKLSIQPLVENAIKYALEEMIDDCMIHINIGMNNENLEIKVKNNGSQFEDDLLAKLRERKVQPHGLGIGLLNIDTRVKLTFGDHYGLSFCNENDFAIAIITIPYIN